MCSILVNALPSFEKNVCSHMLDAGFGMCLLNQCNVFHVKEGVLEAPIF